MFTPMPGMSNVVKDKAGLLIGISDNIIRIDIQKDIAKFDAIKSFRASKLFVDRNKQVLVGNIFGLWKYIDRQIIPYDSTKAILRSRITDIAEYKSKLLCLGTRGKGLLLVSNDSIYQIAESEGLISNNIRKIFIGQQRIWLATNKGVSILHIKSLHPLVYSIQNMSVQDGLLSNEINDITQFQDQVLIATNAGVSFLNKDYFLAKKTTPLPFYLLSTKLNGTVVEPAALTNIRFNTRNLSVSFEALSFNNYGKTNYRYRLKGFDTTWFYTNDLQVQFNPLPYGKYELQLQAKREFDSWEQVENHIFLPIECKPPFWATAWFWVLCLVLLFAIFVLYFRHRIKLIRQRQREQDDLKARISETEQMALKAQMNPHFIFNSLNSIQQYVIDSDVKGANSFITGFSKLMRQTLEFSSKNTISLEEEISYLTNYLALEKARMESQFVYEVEIQTEQPVSSLEIPPLLLQPYVENALRHGVRYLKNRNGLIQLRFQQQGSHLVCTIEDNGIGRGKAGELKAVNPIEYQSRGMSLTAERIALLNAGKPRKIEVFIQDIVDAGGIGIGTSVQVRFPV